MVASRAARHDGGMPIVPDTKNWTWVLERPCPECGFDAASVDHLEVAAALRENAAAWPGVLARSDARMRPDDSTWSALEYGAHVRDVHRLNTHRIRLMLDEVDPEFPNWDQDATAIAQRYDLQDPLVVSGEVQAAALELADLLDSLSPEQWQRTGRRSDGATFTPATFAVYFLHDVEHHVWDVTK